MKLTLLCKCCKRYVPILVICVIIFKLFSGWQETRGYQQTPNIHTIREINTLPPIREVPQHKWMLVNNATLQTCYQLLKYSDWTIVLLTDSANQSRFENCIILGSQNGTKANEKFGLYYIIKHPVDVVLLLEQPISNLELEYILQTVPNKRGTQLTMSLSHPSIIDIAQVHYGCQIDSLTNKLSIKPYYEVCLSNNDKYIVSPVICNEGHKNCDASAPVINIAENNYAHISYHGAVFSRSTLWAAGFQCYDQAPMSKSNVVLRLAVQTLLWLGGGIVRIPWLNHIANVTDFEGAFSADGNGGILEILRKMNCSEMDFSHCGMAVIDILTQHKFIDLSCTKEVKTWFMRTAEISTNIKNPIHKDSCISKASYFPKLYQNRTVINRNLNASLHLYDKTCRPVQKLVTLHNHSALVNLTYPWSQFNDILLLIVFNTPHYEALPYVHTLYQPFFTNIVYCGPGEFNLQKYPQLTDFKVNFISYNTTKPGYWNGSFSYECALTVMQMNFNVKGVLTIGDDLLLLVHKVVKMDMDSIWFLPSTEFKIGDFIKMKECRLGMCDFSMRAQWWVDYRSHALDLLDHIQYQQYSNTLRECSVTLTSLTGGSKRLFGGYSDIFYIPRKLHSRFVELASVFLQYQVFVEIAIPSVIRCLTHVDYVTPVYGLTIWTDARDKPWVYFNFKSLAGKDYYHPVKWGMVVNNVTGYLELYCNKVLPFMHDKYSRFTYV